jgi:hypothetical protein
LLVGGCTGAEQDSAYYRREKAEEATYSAGFREDAEQVYLDELAERAFQADEWADTYLAADKAVAVYWRHAYVDRDLMTGERTGKLGTPEGRLI